MLDNRKERILRAIIEEYIETAEPVGSKCLHSKYGIEFSTATIRNEMAEMEQMGFLVQPHTSAGRIPSDKAYRHYVNEIIGEDNKQTTVLSKEDVEKIRTALHTKVDEVSDMLKIVADVISDVTDYTSFAITPRHNNSVVSALQVIPAQDGFCLVLVVTEAGPAHSTVVKIPQGVSKEYVISFSEFLNRKLTGHTVESITPELCENMVRSFELDSNILVPVVNGVLKCIKQIDSREILFDGKNKMFRHPEFNDIARAKSFFDLIDSEKLLLEAGNTANRNTQTDYLVRIGDENESSELKEMSMLTSQYQLGDQMLGDIGIIGPTRMDYAKVIACIKYIKYFFDNELNNT